MTEATDASLQPILSPDPLGDRMKKYEFAFRHSIPQRLPVIIRVDGRAFHTLTRNSNCDKPFDYALMCAMNQVGLALCEEIQGAQMAYIQSDEVSVLVHNYKRLATQAWFDNRIQKMASISAAIATARFNKNYALAYGDAQFDSRVFVLPEAEVCNYFIWRQQDWTRNSVSMVAQSMYSHTELHGKSQSGMHEMIHAKGKNWNDLPTEYKRGRCVQRLNSREWYVDREIPIFSKIRYYIEYYLEVEEETGEQASSSQGVV